MTAVTIDERRSALAVAAGLTLAASAVAAVVRVGWAAEARRLLGFGFTGVPARLDTAFSIFASNARLLAAVFAAILVAQSPWLADRDAARGPVMSALTNAQRAGQTAGLQCSRRARLSRKTSRSI